MADESHPAQTVGDGIHGMADMDHKRRSADVRPIRVRRPDTEILTEFDSGRPGGEQPIHLGFLDAGIGQGVLCRLGVELERRFLRHDADLIGLINPDDGYSSAQCIHSPFHIPRMTILPLPCASARGRVRVSQG